MAKAAVAAVAAASLAFAIETGVALPAVVRGAAGAKGTSPYLPSMQGLQLATDPTKLQSFFVPAEISATITDDAEKAKATKEASRKIANRISGLARRLTDADPTLAYAIRTMTDTNGKTGIRVFRVKAEPKVAKAPKVAPAPATAPPVAATTAAT